MQEWTQRLARMVAGGVVLLLVSGTVAHMDAVTGSDRLAPAWRLYLGGLYDRAMAEFAAVWQSTQSPEAALALALLHDRRGQRQPAARYYDAAVQADPRLEVARVLQADRAFAAGAYQEAAQLYARALMADPTLAKAHYGFGLVALRLGAAGAWPVTFEDPSVRDAMPLGSDWRREAVQRFEKAIALSPELVAAYRHAGETLVALGEYDAAIQWLRRGIQLQPTSAALHTALGRAYEGQGLIEAAVREYARALLHDPDDAEAKAGLLRLGRP